MQVMSAVQYITVSDQARCFWQVKSVAPLTAVIEHCLPLISCNSCREVNVTCLICIGVFGSVELNFTEGPLFSIQLNDPQLRWGR